MRVNIDKCIIQYTHAAYFIGAPTTDNRHRYFIGVPTKYRYTDQMIVFCRCPYVPRFDLSDTLKKKARLCIREAMIIFVQSGEWADVWWCGMGEVCGILEALEVEFKATPWQEL